MPDSRLTRPAPGSPGRDEPSRGRLCPAGLGTKKLFVAADPGNWPGVQPLAGSTAHRDVTAVGEPCVLVVTAQPVVGCDAVKPQRVAPSMPGEVFRPGEDDGAKASFPAAYGHPVNVSGTAAGIAPHRVGKVHGDGPAYPAVDIHQPCLAAPDRALDPGPLKPQGPLLDIAGVLRTSAAPRMRHLDEAGTDHAPLR